MRSGWTRGRPVAKSLPLRPVHRFVISDCGRCSLLGVLLSYEQAGGQAAPREGAAEPGRSGTRARRASRAARRDHRQDTRPRGGGTEPGDHGAHPRRHGRAGSTRRAGAGRRPGGLRPRGHVHDGPMRRHHPADEEADVLSHEPRADRAGRRRPRSFSITNDSLLEPKRVTVRLEPLIGEQRRRPARRPRRSRCGPPASPSPDGLREVRAVPARCRRLRRPTSTAAP